MVPTLKIWDFLNRFPQSGHLFIYMNVQTLHLARIKSNFVVRHICPLLKYPVFYYTVTSLFLLEVSQTVIDTKVLGLNWKEVPVWFSKPFLMMANIFYFCQFGPQ